MFKIYVLPLIFIITVYTIFTGCAPANLQIAANYYYYDKPEKALTSLEKYKNTKVNNILYLVEKGMILQELKDYNGSNVCFNQAHKLIEKYTKLSVSKTSGSFLINDYIKTWTGEKFEKVWVNTLSAINYLMLKKYDDALVECKRALKKLDNYKADYSYYVFTRYLSSISYRLSGDYNDAYIELKKIYSKNKNIDFVNRDLLILSKILGIYEDYNAYRKKFKNLINKIKYKDYGELVIILQSGKGPVKYPKTIILPEGTKYSVPYYKPRYSQTDYAKIFINGKFIKKTVTLTDLSKTTEKFFNNKLTKKNIKEAGRVIIKNQISQKVYQKNEELGVLAKLLLNSVEQADLRCWNTLPEKFQIMSLQLVPGDYTVKLEIYDDLDNVLQQIFYNINIEEYKTRIINLRTIK